ncbi:hypothetical protein H0W91_03505 [Patescibacteria group bacterium]|nr:hypothetical protein [Patescibacteria group bacterium]
MAERIKLGLSGSDQQSELKAPDRVYVDGKVTVGESDGKLGLVAWGMIILIVILLLTLVFPNATNAVLHMLHIR